MTQKQEGSDRNTGPMVQRFRYTAANDCTADIQWIKDKSVYWLKLYNAVQCEIKQKTERVPVRKTGNKKRTADEPYKVVKVPGVYRMKTSWADSWVEGTRDEMEAAAVAALDEYRKMMRDWNE